MIGYPFKGSVIAFTLVNLTACRRFGSASAGLPVPGPITSSKIKTSPTCGWPGIIWDWITSCLVVVVAASVSGAGGAGGLSPDHPFFKLALVAPLSRQHSRLPQV